jgi:hypothetical protein
MISNQFAAWKSTPGGRRIMQMAYALAARYAARYERKERRVSMKLIWELLRDNVASVARSRGEMALPKVDGFTLNNNFTALIAREMLTNKPKWAGLFELRERKEHEQNQRDGQNSRSHQVSGVHHGNGSPEQVEGCAVQSACIDGEGQGEAKGNAGTGGLGSAVGME